jgi:carboxymethylenebutenolidase
MGERMSFKRPDGGGCNGYLARAAGAGRPPGIVVIQEWWGLNDQIKGVADRLAGAGYHALVPDLYRGKVTLEAAEAHHMMEGLNFGDAATQDIRGAVQYLKTQCPKVGVTGFCMGGVLTILAAVHVKEADAASAWYGYPPPEAGDVRTIRIPVQAHFAVDDVPFPIAGVDGLEARLKEGKVGYDFHRYKAGHAFANESGPNYNPEAAALAWQRTMTFFATHLNG